ncbi:MAG TPA: hypothetical protein VKP10_01295, partial [Gemmatimonadales bacterium]|nr:hypothetical protein [Gemmatimonadales bacterium]
VVVPVDLASQTLVDSGRVLAPGRTQRYFLRAAVPGRTLRVTATVADSEDAVFLQLYDPASHPASADPDSLVVLGNGKSSTVMIEIPAEDMPAGVYELDLLNPGSTRATVSLRAQLAPVALAPAARGDGLEAFNPGATSANITAAAALVGAERQWEVAGRGAPAETVLVTVPAWAARAEVQVSMPVAQWEQLTDFGVTVFDSMGQQVHAAALNYARGRQAFEVPEAIAGHTTRIELFPGFARPDSAPPWKASVRVRFFTDARQALGPPHLLNVVAGGRAVLPALGSAPPPIELPEGFAPLIVWRLTPPAGGGGGAAVAFETVQP